MKITVNRVRFSDERRHSRSLYPCQEGSCILTGLTYNGRADDGVERWDGCANILVADYERASSATQIVQSFNVNTNRWMAK